MKNYKPKKFKNKKFEHTRGKKPSLARFIVPYSFFIVAVILFIKGLINYQPENDQSWQFLLRNWKGIAFVIFLILLVPIIMGLINWTAKRWKTD